MSGGKKKQGQQGQKHQNKTAFKILFNPLALEIHKKVSFRGLCKRCSDQISWKLQYNKYKRMAQPSRCALCHQKNVLRTYMTACEPCSQALKMCPKCLDPESEEQAQVRLTEKQQKRIDEESERKMNDFIKTLKERSRRTVKRLYEKGTITWDPQLNNFLDQQGNTLPLQFRQGYGANVSNAGEDQEQIDEFGDEDQEQEEFDEDDEQQEETSKKKESKMKDNKQKTDKKEKDEDQEQEDEENNQQFDEGSDQDQQQDDQDGQNEVSQKTRCQQQKQSVPANQNEQDWQDVDEEQEQDADDNQEQQQSEKEQELHKKKRKPHTNHRGKHRK